MASTTDEYTLNWNDQANSLSISLKDLLEQKELVDVTLVADGHLFSAHRLILAALSPYFRHIFAQVPANQQAFVFLKDVPKQTLEDLITFIYCGKVSVKQENLAQLLDTAKAFDINGLADDGYTKSTESKSPISSTPSYSCEQFQSIRTIPVPDPVKSNGYETSHYEPSINSLYQHDDNFALDDFNEMNGHNYDNTDLFDADDMSNANSMPMDQEYAMQDDQWNQSEEMPAKPKRTKTKRARINVAPSGYNTVADIRTNGKGYQNLFIDDQKFNRHHRPNAQGQQRWQCTTQRQTKCRAAATTMMLNGIEMMKIVCAEHTH